MVKLAQPRPRKLGREESPPYLLYLRESSPPHLLSLRESSPPLPPLPSGEGEPYTTGSACRYRNNMRHGAVFRFGHRELAVPVWALWIHSGVSRPAGSLRKRASCDARRRPPSDTRGRCCGIGVSWPSNFGANTWCMGSSFDFYCATERLVVELEGAPHAGRERRAYDAARAATLEAAGYRVIRIANRDVTRDHLVALLSRALGDRASFPLSRRERGTGGEDQRTGEGDRG